MSQPVRIAVVLVAALGMAAAAAGLRATTIASHERVIADEDRYYLPPSIWLRAFSMGYNEALADFLWIKAVVYFGGMHQPRTQPTAVYTKRYVNTVTDLDPRFVKPYVIGSRLVLYHMRKLSLATVEAAMEVLDKGAAVFPDNGEIAFGLGFFYYYELPQFLDDKAERSASRERGAKLLRRAATMEGAPPYASLLGVRVLRREGLDELVVEHLRTMLISETDPIVRESLEHQLQRELGKAAERDIQRSRALNARWRREMPYVPFDLFLLLGDPQPVSAAEVLDPLLLADQGLGLLEQDEAEEPAEP
jgi:hypothetical protein